MHLLAKNNRKKKGKPNKQMQTILNQLLQLPASDLRFSWRQVHRLLSWMWLSYFTNTSEESFASKTTSLTTQHHIQEMTCSVHKRNHCSPSKHHYPIFTEWLPKHLHYKVIFLCTTDKSIRPVATKKWGRCGLFSVCVVHSSTFGRFHEHFEKTCHNPQD